LDDRLTAGIIPAPIPSATQTGCLCPRRAVSWDLIAVEVTGATGVALLGEDHADVYQFRLVGKHLDETSMRGLHLLLTSLSGQAYTSGRICPADAGR
jgi:hypothetical protein